MRLAVRVALVLAACKAPPRAPTARIDPQAAPLLDAWAVAIGGHDRIAALHGLHVTQACVSDGVRSTEETWWTERGELRVREESAGQADVIDYDGARAWLADPSGLVLELSGPDLEDMRAAAFLWTSSALVQGRLAGEITTKDQTLELEPDGVTQPIELELDAGTRRPRRVTRVIQGDTVVTELRDWRDVDGVAMPFASHSVAVTTADCTTTAVDHSTAVVGAIADRSDDVRFTAGQPIEIPFALDGGRIFTHASIDGADVELFVDSGARTTFDPTRVPGTVAPAAAGSFSGEHGVGQYGFAPGTTIAVPGLELGPYTAMTLSFAQNYADERPTLAALVGIELFERVVVEIDYPHGKLRFYDRTLYKHPAGGTQLPFVLVERSPAIEAVIETPGGEVRGRFLVDTGCACDAIAMPWFVQAHALVAPDAAHTERFALATVDAIRLGNRRIERPRVLASTTAQRGIFASRDQAGMLGGKLLQRFRVTIDYARRIIWLDDPT